MSPSQATYVEDPSRIRDLEKGASKVSLPAFYRPELDALRFLAFILVFLFHFPFHDLPKVILNIAGAGTVGVCLFFLLSSYLITELLQREDDRTHNIHLRGFYLRRVLRIWPLYFFTLFFARLLELHSPAVQMTWPRILASIALAGNWYTFFYGMPTSFARVLWSISVEEQFYLFWPSVQKWLGKRALLLIGLATLPTSFFTIYWLASTSHSDTQIWVNTLVQAQYFGIGGVIAILLRHNEPRFSIAARTLLLTAGLIFWYMPHRVFHGLPTPQQAIGQYACITVGTVFIFFSFLGFAQLRHARALIYLGKISYGLYVFHLLAIRIAVRGEAPLQRFLPSPLVQLALAIVAFAISLLMAHLSYRYFESPFLRLKRRFEVVHSRAI